MSEEDKIEYLSQFLTEERLQLMSEKLQLRTRYITLVLEDIFQSQNGAACLRSAESFGIQDVHLIENRNEFVTHKDVLRGASKWLTLHRYREEKNNTRRCLSALKKKGYQLIATTPDSIESAHRNMIENNNGLRSTKNVQPSVIPLNELDVSTKVALMIGTEKTGLSAEAMSQADQFLTIPMCGFTESLNLSATAAIILYTLRQRLDQPEISWRLLPKEVEELQAKWIRKSLGYRLEKLEREYFHRNDAAERSD